MPLFRHPGKQSRILKSFFWLPKHWVFTTSFSAVGQNPRMLSKNGKRFRVGGCAIIRGLLMNSLKNMEESNGLFRPVRCVLQVRAYRFIGMASFKPKMVARNFGSLRMKRLPKVLMAHIPFY